MERSVNYDSNIAKVFADILGKASIVPIALSAPAAIVLEQAHSGVASAQGCVVKVEVSPALSTKNPSRVEQTFPCAKRVDIGVDPNKDYLITAEIDRVLDWWAFLGYGSVGLLVGGLFIALLRPDLRRT